MAPANPEYMAQIDAMFEGMEASGADLQISSLSRNLTRDDILAENAYGFLLYFKLYGS